jgi:hypothetical protein
MEAKPVTPPVQILQGADAKIESTPKEPVVTNQPIKDGDKKFLLTFGNEKEEVDEATLLQYAQKARAADKTFQEAATQRKQVEQILENLKTSPGKAILNKAFGHKAGDVLKDIINTALNEGYDAKELKEILSEQMYEWIQEENLDPREREIRDLKKQLEKRNQADKEAAEAKFQAELKQKTDEAVKAFNEDITETLKTSGLPKSTFTVKRMAYWLDQAFKVKADYAKQGITIRDPKAADIVTLVKKDYEDSFKELYSASDVDTLANLLGKDTLDKIRKYDVQKLMEKKPGSDKKPSNVAPQKKQELKPKVKNNWLKQRENEIREKERLERGS